MSHAILAARKAKEDAVAGSERAKGEVHAYYDLLDVLKEQADFLGIQWADQSLAGFDPDTLL